MAASPSLPRKAKCFRNYAKLSSLVKLIQNHKPELKNLQCVGLSNPSQVQGKRHYIEVPIGQTQIYI